MTEPNGPEKATRSGEQKFRKQANFADTKEAIELAFQISHGRERWFEPSIVHSKNGLQIAGNQSLRLGAKACVQQRG